VHQVFPKLRYISNRLHDTRSQRIVSSPFLHTRAVNPDRGVEKLYNEELNDLYSSPNIVRVIKSRIMRWPGHIVRMGERRDVYRVLVGKPEGKRPLGRPRCRWEDNIKMDLQEVGCGCMDWIGLAQDRNSWRALMTAVMNLRIP